MRGKLWFIGGMAAGFVLGARAGREKYEELVVKGRKILDHPTVQEAAGVAQAQATRLYSEGRDRLSQIRLGEKLGNGGRSSDDTSAVLDSPPGNLAGSTTGTGRSAGSTASTNRSKPTTPGTSSSTL